MKINQQNFYFFTIFHSRKQGQGKASIRVYYLSVPIPMARKLDSRYLADICQINNGKIQFLSSVFFPFIFVLWLIMIVSDITI